MTKLSKDFDKELMKLIKGVLPKNREELIEFAKISGYLKDHNFKDEYYGEWRDEWND